MSSIIQQIDFSLGQVDDLLDTDTSQESFLSALKRLENGYVGGHRTPRRRPSFVDTGVSTYFSSTRRTLSLQDKDGTWYTLVLRTNGTSTEISIHKWALNSESVLTPAESKVLATDANTSISEYDFTATDNYIVLVTGRIAPRRITINSTAFQSTTISNIAFSVVPSLDFEDVDYSGFTFTPKCSNGSDPTGSPPACSSNSVFGGIIEVNSGSAFTSDWVGGLIVGRTGASVEQPIGIALIKSITQIDASNQRFTCTVLQQFGTQHYSTSGVTWDVRKPLWGNRAGGAPVYPTKTAFFKGRLWFANTSEKPMMVAGSVQNNPSNFDVRRGESPDAIVYILSDSEGGGIKHIFGSVNLHVFTESKELTIQGGLDVGIDPGNFSPQESSSFTSSTLKPIIYKNSVYYVTADGQALVRMVENERQVSAQIISNNSQDLIKSPVAMSVFNIDNNQDRILTLLNSDGTATIYSSTGGGEVSAFSSLTVSMQGTETLADIYTVSNRLYVVSSIGRTAYSSSDVDFDYRRTATSASGIFSVDTSLQVGEMVGVTYQGTVGTQINHNYLGEFEVIEINGVKRINLNNPTLNASVRYGKIYTTTIQSLPLFSTSSGSFLKRRVSQMWCQFSSSYNCTVNGVVAGLPSSSQVQPPGANPQRVTGTIRIGGASGYEQDNYVTIVQSSPYPVNIQKIAWLIDEKVIA